LFEAYFDDSGTHRSSDLAIAVCYVSTQRAWNEFAREWDQIREEEGFDFFHMVDFASPAEYRKRPYCDWTKEKKQRVYARLAQAINIHKRVGIGIAIPKAMFDSVVPTLPDLVQKQCGRFHYTFAVKSLMVMMIRWRQRHGLNHSVRFVFDTITEGADEIRSFFEEMDTYSSEFREKLGLEFGGFSIESKARTRALQAADILAWQMNWHMRKVIAAGKDDVGDCHPNFRMLRENQAMELGFMTETNFLNSVNRQIEFNARHSS